MGGDLGEDILLNSADSSSLSKPTTRFTPSCSAEFEKPTSAPLIAPVDTITPVPLLYHVRTFYIVRYSSPTGHPSQPTYTINELQKKKKKNKQRRMSKKKSLSPHSTSTYNSITQYKTPHPQCTSNIQIHSLQPTFMCPRSIARVPFDSVRRSAGLLITVYHLYASLS